MHRNDLGTLPESVHAAEWNGRALAATTAAAFRPADDAALLGANIQDKELAHLRGSPVDKGLREWLRGADVYDLSCDMRSVKPRRNAHGFLMFS